MGRAIDRYIDIPSNPWGRLRPIYGFLKQTRDGEGRHQASLKCEEQPVGCVKKCKTEGAADPHNSVHDIPGGRNWSADVPPKREKRSEKKGPKYHD